MLLQAAHLGVMSSTAELEGSLRLQQASMIMQFRVVPIHLHCMWRSIALTMRPYHIICATIAQHATLDIHEPFTII